LKLPGVQFFAFDYLAKPAVVSSVMTPAEAWAIWQQLAEREAELGLVAVVIDAGLAELEDGTQTLATEVEDGAQEELAAIVADARRKVGQLSAKEFFDRRADDQEGWREWLALATKVSVETLPPTTWPELHQRCAQIGIPCPDANPMAPHLAEIDAKVDAGFLGAVEYETPLFARPRRDGEAVQRVRILLLATIGTELPLELYIGGLYDCPPPHEQAVVLAHWSRDYGARIVYDGEDVLEMVIERPPQTVEQLRRLTREHYVYSPDVVHEGVGSTTELARILARSTVWYFRRDSPVPSATGLRR
jgi:hypothetical protein